VAVCIDDIKAANKIVQLVKHEFPHAKLLVRAFDRAHALDLVAARVDYQVREMLESAFLFGEAALKALGVPEQEAAEILVDIRRRDAERFEMQLAGGISASRDLLISNIAKPTPAPLTPPKQAARPLSEETAALTRSAVATTEAEG
jgi:glutathione-regulated potassium-efflux system protein KefB